MDQWPAREYGYSNMASSTQGNHRGEQGYTAWRLNTLDSPYFKVGACVKPDIREEFLSPVGQLVNKKNCVTLNFAVGESMEGRNSCVGF
jgi:hypothetical protein